MKTKELSLPLNYVDINNDEMEYIDGGYEVIQTWWGKGIRMNGPETAQFLSDASWATGILCAALGLLTPIASAAVGITVGAYGLTISRMNANNSGVTFMWTWANLAFMMLPGTAAFAVLPAVGDNY